MALIKCKECGKEVSDTARNCPSCGVVIFKPKRGFFGKLFKFLFIVFNLLMAYWLFSAWGQIGQGYNEMSEAEQMGTAIGGTLGSMIVFSIWGIGDLILGLMVLLTRPK